MYYTLKWNIHKNILETIEVFYLELKKTKTEHSIGIFKMQINHDL